MVCNLCQIPVVAPAGFAASYLDSPLPQILDHGGRRYVFCSEPCKWVFEQSPSRFGGHLNLIDRFLAGHIQPMDLMGALSYMSLGPTEMGQDATNYEWATETNGLHVPKAGA